MGQSEVERTGGVIQENGVRAYGGHGCLCSNVVCCQLFLAVNGVWDVAKYLIAVALVAALVFNVFRKQKGGLRRRLRRPATLGGQISPRFLTAGVAVLLVRNWFLEIAGADGGGSKTELVWFVVNVLFPLGVRSTDLTPSYGSA